MISIDRDSIEATVPKQHPLQSEDYLKLARIDSDFINWCRCDGKLKVNGEIVARLDLEGNGASKIVSSSNLAPDGTALPSLDTPTVANGKIDGLAGKDNVPMEIRLRPQPNGFLHGELVIHEAGYGLTPIDGFIRGSHINFQVPYGGRVLYFEGQRRREQMSGSFQSEPSGERGNWSARVD